MSNTVAILIFSFVIWMGNGINCNPIPKNTTGSPWQNEQRNLRQFQSYLLNKTILPFLSDCYEDNCCVNAKQILCPTYYELVMRTNTSKRMANITEATLQELSSDKSEQTKDDVKAFCENFSKIIPELSLKWNASDIRRPLANMDHVYCTHICFSQRMSENMMNILFARKPICNVISWMGNSMASETIPPQINDPTSIGKKNVQNVPESIVEQADKTNTNEEDPAEKDAKAVNNKANSTEDKNAIPQQPIEKVKEISTKSKADNLKTNVPGKTSLVTTQAIGNKTEEKDPKTVPDTNVEKPQYPENPEASNKKSPTENEKPLNGNVEIPVDNAKDSNGEVPLGKLPSDQVNDANGENVQEDTEEVFGQDSPKSDPLLYSGEDDNGIDDARLAQADTKQKPKDPALEKLIEPNLQDTQKPEPGVSSNYIVASDPFYEEAGSNFFTYFLIGMFVCILLYVLYHNKTKVLALILEGRRSQKNRGGRRKHTAQYRKLDTNLEEAITSSANARSSQIIY